MPLLESYYEVMYTLRMQKHHSQLETLKPSQSSTDLTGPSTLDHQPFPLGELPTIPMEYRQCAYSAIKLMARAALTYLNENNGRIPIRHDGC